MTNDIVNANELISRLNNLAGAFGNADVSRAVTRLSLSAGRVLSLREVDINEIDNVIDQWMSSAMLRSAQFQGKSETYQRMRWHEGKIAAAARRHRKILRVAECVGKVRAGVSMCGVLNDLLKTRTAPFYEDKTFDIRAGILSDIEAAWREVVAVHMVESAENAEAFSGSSEIQAVIPVMARGLGRQLRQDDIGLPDLIQKLIKIEEKLASAVVWARTQKCRFMNARNDEFPEEATEAAKIVPTEFWPFIHPDYRPSKPQAADAPTISS